MDDEFDLRQYAKVLVKYRGWILGATLAGALLAAAVSLVVLPVRFSTEAIVVTGVPTLRVSLGSAAMPASEAKVSAKAYAAMAKNRRLLQQVVASMGSALPESLRSAGSLDRQCSLSSLGDPSVLRFSVRYSDPQVAAQIANAWASQYVAAMREAYGQSNADIAAITKQIEAAEQSLFQTELALSDFRTANPTAVLRATVAAYTSALSENLAAETSVESSLRDAQSLRQRLQVPGALSEDLARTLAAVIEINALGSRNTSGVQVQVPFAPPSASQEGLPKSTQDLDTLVASLLERRQALAGERQRASEQLLRAQGELEPRQMQNERLNREWAAAVDTLQALERQSKEMHIAGQLDRVGVRVALPAAVPEEPEARHTALNTTLGAAVGLVLAIIAVLAAEYSSQARRSSRTTETAE